MDLAGAASKPHNHAIGRPVRDARLLDESLHGPRPASLRSEHHASTVIQERESQFDHHVQGSLTSDVPQRGDVNEAIDRMAEDSRCETQ